MSQKEKPPNGAANEGCKIIKLSDHVSKLTTKPKPLKNSKQLLRALEFVETQGEIKERALLCQALKK